MPPRQDMSLELENRSHTPSLSADSGYATATSTKAAKRHGAETEPLEHATTETQGSSPNNNPIADAPTDTNTPFPAEGDEQDEVDSPISPPASRSGEYEITQDSSASARGVAGLRSKRGGHQSNAPGYNIQSKSNVRQSGELLETDAIAGASSYKPPTVSLDVETETKELNQTDYPPKSASNTVPKIETAGLHPVNPDPKHNAREIEEKTPSNSTAANANGIHPPISSVPKWPPASRDILHQYVPPNFASISEPASQHPTFYRDVGENKPKARTTKRPSLYDAGREVMSRNARLKRTYIYKKLDEGEVRFLLLQPHNNNKDSEIKCTVLRRRLDDPNVNGKFHALST